MFYTIRGEVDGFEDTSYERTVKGKAEIVTKFRLSLLVPGTNELVSVDLTAETAPPEPTQEKWEDARTWVVVTADAMRHMKGETEGRAWSMISFNGVTVQEMSAKDLGDMQKARRDAKKARKAAQKAKKAAAQAEPKAA